MKEFLTQGLMALGGTVMALGAIFAAVLLTEFRRRAKQATADAAVRTLRELAATAVKSVEQTQVIAHKDPAKASLEWDEAAATQAKGTALLTLRVAGRASLEALKEAGSSQTDLDALTLALIEAAVLDLRTRKVA